MFRNIAIFPLRAPKYEHLRRYSTILGQVRNFEQRERKDNYATFEDTRCPQRRCLARSKSSTAENFDEIGDDIVQYELEGARPKEKIDKDGAYNVFELFDKHSRSDMLEYLQPCRQIAFGDSQMYSPSMIMPENPYSRKMVFVRKMDKDDESIKSPTNYNCTNTDNEDVWECSTLRGRLGKPTKQRYNFDNNEVHYSTKSTAEGPYDKVKIPPNEESTCKEDNQSESSNMNCASTKLPYRSYADSLKQRSSKRSEVAQTNRNSDHMHIQRRAYSADFHYRCKTAINDRHVPEVKKGITYPTLRARSESKTRIGAKDKFQAKSKVLPKIDFGTLPAYTPYQPTVNPKVKRLNMKDLQTKLALLPRQISVEETYARPKRPVRPRTTTPYLAKPAMSADASRQSRPLSKDIQSQPELALSYAKLPRTIHEGGRTFKIATRPKKFIDQPHRTDQRPQARKKQLSVSNEKNYKGNVRGSATPLHPHFDNLDENIPKKPISPLTKGAKTSRSAETLMKNVRLKRTKSAPLHISCEPSGFSKCQAIVQKLRKRSQLRTW